MTRKSLASSFGIVGLSFSLGIAASPHLEGLANAGGSPLQSALDHLKAAKSDLEKAGSDSAGHRSRAIQATNEAIDATTKAAQGGTAEPACAGCATSASDINVVAIQSSQYSREQAQGAINARKGELLKCFAAGWSPEKEGTLDYLLEYDANAGTVVLLKGPMFGKAMNEKVLSCMNAAIKGAPIGKARAISYVKGFSVTLKVTK